MGTRHAVFSCSDANKKHNPEVLSCELSRLLRHLPIDEINHKMFCPESSLSLLQVDVCVWRGETTHLSAHFLEKNSKSLLCSLSLK